MTVGFLTRIGFLMEGDSSGGGAKQKDRKGPNQVDGTSRQELRKIPLAQSAKYERDGYAQETARNVGNTAAERAASRGKEQV